MADTPFNLLELPGVFEPGVYASVVYDSDPGLAAHRIGFAQAVALTAILTTLLCPTQDSGSLWYMRVSTPGFTRTATIPPAASI